MHPTTSISNLLQKLNHCQGFEKPTIHFKDLKIAKSYLIEAMKIVNTRYGLRLLMDIGECMFFCPERFAKDFNDVELEEYSSANQKITLKKREDNSLMFYFS